LARFNLHLSEREFWSLTLKELSALIERYNDQVEMDNIRFGQLIALTANIHRDPKKRSKPFTAGDFFHITERKRAPEPKKLTPEEAIEYLRRQNAFAGGKEISR
jgi:hypothetical protein